MLLFAPARGWVCKRLLELREVVHLPRVERMYNIPELARGIFAAVLVGNARDDLVRERQRVREVGEPVPDIGFARRAPEAANCEAGDVLEMPLRLVSTCTGPLFFAVF